MKRERTSLKWREPWSWARAKVNLALIERKYVSWKRMILLTVVLPALAVLLVRQFVPSLAEVLPWSLACGIVLSCVVVMFLAVYSEAFLPRQVRIGKGVVVFAWGDGKRIAIKPNQIISLAIEHRDGIRYFVIRSMSARKDGQAEFFAEIPRRITEDEIAETLQRNGLHGFFMAAGSHRHLAPEW